MRFIRIVLTIMVFLIISSGLSHGSLGQGHIYVAEKLLAKMPAQLKKLIEKEKSAYLAGANGVDIVFWAYFKAHFTNSKLPNAPPKPFDLHTNTPIYNTGHKALEILDESKKYSMKEEAFAVGWLTHWLVDAYVHTLIGYYGGDYRDDEKENECTPTGSCRHTQLEIAESKHLCSSEKHAPYSSFLKTYSLSRGDIPEGFIEDLFKKGIFVSADHKDVYMQGSITQKPIVFGLTGASNLDVGRDSVSAAMECCQYACSKERNDCRDTPFGVLSQNVWERNKQSFLLDKDDYFDIRNAIRINVAEFLVEEGSLRAVIEVNDTQLYGKFLVEWDRVLSDLETFVDKKQLFHILQAFLGPAEADPAENKAREALRDILAKIPNILTPRNEMTQFDPDSTKRYTDGTLRGAPDFTSIHYEIASTCDGGKTFNKTLSGTVPISPPSAGKRRIRLFGSKSGSASIKPNLEGDGDKTCHYVLLASFENPGKGQGSYKLDTVEEGGIRKVRVLTRDQSNPADPEFKLLEYDWVSGDYKKSSDLKSRAEAKYEWMKNTIPYLEKLIELDEKAFTDLEKKVRKEVLGGVASGKFGVPPVPKECSGKSRDEMARRIAEVEKALPNTYKCGMFLEDPLTKEMRWGCTHNPQYQKLASERSVLEICLNGRDPVNYWELKCIDSPVRERREHKEMLKAKLAAAKDSKAYRFFKEYAGYNDYKGYLKEIERTRRELDLPDPIPSPVELPWTYYSGTCGVGGAVQEAGKLQIQLTKYPEKNTYNAGEKITFTAEPTGGKAPYSYEWTGDYEGKDKSVAVPLSRIGQNRLKVSVRDSAGSMGDAVVAFEVVALQLELTFEPKEPYVGQELKAKLTVKPEAKEIDFRWMPLPDNVKPAVEVKDGREIAFTLTNDNPAEIKARAMTLKGGEVLGEGKNTIKARMYAVNVTGPKAMGPKSKVWKEGVGLVDLEKEIAVDEVVEFAADTQPAALTGPVKYKWTATGDSCALDHATSRAVRATASAAGGCALSVVITDRNGVQLGEGKGSFNATITREEINQGKEKARNIEDAKKKVQDAKVKERKGDLDGAIMDVDGALKLDEKNREAAAISAKLRKDRETIGIQLGKARTLIGENRFPDAQRELFVAKNLHGLYPPVLETDRELGDKWRAYDGQVRDKIYEVRSANEKKDFGKALEIAAAWRASTKLDPYAEKELKQQEDWAKQWKALKDRQIGVLKEAGEKVKYYDYAGALKQYDEGFANGQNLYNGTEPEYKEAVELRSQAFTKNKRLGELTPHIRNAAENKESYYGQTHVLDGALKAADEAIALQPTNEQLKKWREQIVARAEKTKADNERIAQGRKYLDAAGGAERGYLTNESSIQARQIQWNENVEVQQHIYLTTAIQNYRASLQYIPDAAVEKKIKELEVTLEGRKKYLENYRLSVTLKNEADVLVQLATKDPDIQTAAPKYDEAIEKYRKSLSLYRPFNAEMIERQMWNLEYGRHDRWVRKYWADGQSLEKEAKYTAALAAYDKAIASFHPTVPQNDRMWIVVHAQELRNRITGAKNWRADGEVKQNAGKIAEAIASYRQSLKLLPDPALEEHVRMLEGKQAEAGEKKASADRLWQEGTALFNQGRPSDALTKFKESLGCWSDTSRQKYVADLEARRAKAVALREEGSKLQNQNRISEAVAKYRESLNYWPDQGLSAHIATLERAVTGSASGTSTSAGSSGTASTVPADTGFYLVDLTPYGGKKSGPRTVKGVQVDDGSWIRLKATHEKKLSLDIPLPQRVSASAVAIVTNLDNAHNVPDRMTTTVLTAHTTSGDHTFEFKAGVHSSEWNRSETGGATHAWPRETNIGGSRWMAVFNLPAGSVVTGLRFDHRDTDKKYYHGEAAPGFCLRGITLVGSAVGGSATAGQTSVSGGAGGKPLFNNGNTSGVYNNPSRATQFTLSAPHVITLIVNYHWNNGRGANPGTIALRGSDGRTYGPWQAKGTPGQGGARNAYWECSPGATLPAGTYTVIDADPATWAQNSGSQGSGHTRVEGYPVSGGTASTSAVTAGQVAAAPSVTAEITNHSRQNTHIFTDGESFGPGNRLAPGERRKAAVTMKPDGSVTFKAGRNGQVMATKTWRGTPGDTTRVPVVVFDDTNPYDKLTVTTGLR